MNPAKSPESGARPPSAVEIATLAACFLPKIEPPARWETEHPTTLQEHIGKSTGSPYPENPAYRTPSGWRTPWEVLCAEAVSRARILLDAAAGITRPEVLAWEKEGLDFQERAARDQARAGELQEKFDALSRDGQPLPILDALRICLPKTEERTRMRYWEFYLRECQEEYNRRHGVSGAVTIAGQSARRVDRDEFPRLIVSFGAAFGERKEAWRKRLLRGGGEQTQRHKRAEAAKQGHAPVTGRAASRIREAGQRHAAAGKRKK